MFLQESIGSNYSDYDEFAPTVQVAGEIFIGLRYDHKEKSFEVQVHKAKGLLVGDSVENKTNPYVNLNLLVHKFLQGFYLSDPHFFIVDSF